MTYREVTVLEVKEVLRLWLSGVPKKRIARQLAELNVAPSKLRKPKLRKLCRRRSRS
jgi:hypothetical protein